MHLLQSGVDLSAIARWLGHESPELFPDRWNAAFES